MQFFGFPFISLPEISVTRENPRHLSMSSPLDQLLTHLARLPPRPPSSRFGRLDLGGDGLTGPLGRLGRLPTEIQFMIFACLSLDDVGNFALTSKRAKALAAGYLASRACLRRVLSLPSDVAQVTIAYCHLQLINQRNLVRGHEVRSNRQRSNLPLNLTIGHTFEGGRA